MSPNAEGRAAEGRLLDAEALHSACGDDPQIFAHLQAAFRSTVPADMRIAEESLARGDLKTLCEASHRLLGVLSVASRTVGAVASALEDEAATGSTEEARRALGKLQEMVPRLMRQVDSTTLEEIRRVRSRAPHP